MDLNLTMADKLLTFNAFVEATPKAIQEKSVVPGVYNATVEFEVFL